MGENLKQVTLSKSEIENLEKAKEAGKSVAVKARNRRKDEIASLTKIKRRF